MLIPPPPRRTAPVIARSSRLVVLGSFPGGPARRGQYYAHPRNAFWRLLSALWGIDLLALPYPRRLRHAARARARRGTSTRAACAKAAPIRRSKPPHNDLASLRRRAPGLEAIAHNGGESARSARLTAALGLPVYRLPSTSPANASWSFERKLDACIWRCSHATGWHDGNAWAASYPLWLERRPLRPSLAAVARRRSGRAPTISELDGVRYLHLARRGCRARCAWPRRGASSSKVRAAHARLAAVAAVHRALARPRGAARPRRGDVDALLPPAAARRAHDRGRDRPAGRRRVPAMVSPAGRRRPAHGRGGRCRALDRRSAARAASVHALQVDLYDHEAAAPVLDDEAFYRDCRAAPGAGRGPDVGQPVRSRGELRDQRAPHRTCVRRRTGWNLRPTREGNTVVIATRGPALPGVKSWPRVPITSRPARIASAQVAAHDPRAARTFDDDLSPSPTERHVRSLFRPAARAVLDRPDPRFLFGERHREALALLGSGLTRGATSCCHGRGRRGQDDGVATASTNCPPTWTSPTSSTEARRDALFACSRICGSSCTKPAPAWT